LSKTIDFEVEEEAKKKKERKKERMTSAGLDPATLSVLTIRDNQLHQPAIVKEQFRFLLHSPS
jgi:hypothetical protein